MTAPRSPLYIIKANSPQLLLTHFVKSLLSFIKSLRTKQAFFALFLRYAASFVGVFARLTVKHKPAEVFTFSFAFSPLSFVAIFLSVDVIHITNLLQYLTQSISTSLITNKAGYLPRGQIPSNSAHMFRFNRSFSSIILLTGALLKITAVRSVTSPRRCSP